MKVTCENCGAKCRIKEWGTAYPGAKEREYAYCPNCNEELYSRVLPGTSFSVEVIKK